MYENLDELYFALKDKKLFHPFIIIYDNSYDDNYEITSRQKAKNSLESSFLQQYGQPPELKTQFLQAQTTKNFKQLTIKILSESYIT